MKPIMSLFVLLFSLSSIAGSEIEVKYRKTIDKGLKWLSDNQARDGHWDANGGQYPTSMTALAGMALLMEGSTLREGKFSDNIRRAVDWLLDRCMPSGLIGNPSRPEEASRYMYGHGFGMLFLACVYGEEEDQERRKKLEKILTKAVEFCGKAQTEKGGWGYLTAADGNNFDEGSVTITQLQGLRAAKNAGIVVPKSIIDKAVKYLKDCTTDRGGVIYSLSTGRVMGGERPPLTAAAIACSFSAGDYKSDIAKKWLKYCQTAIPIDRSGRDSFGHWEYTHLYYSQALYILGENGFTKLFPDHKGDDKLTWSKYREVTFDFLHSKQNPDGSWNVSHIGPVFSTACCLMIMQLDNANLPIFQR